MFKHTNEYHELMAEALRKRVKQTKSFEGLDQEAMISLMVAASSVRNELEEVCSQCGVFVSQHNILRILAGGPPEGYARQEIINRMIDRGPDVTRLVDQLEEKGLVVRERSDEDRRKVMHRITEKGRALLEEVVEKTAPVHEVFGDELSEEELKELTRLCAKIFQRFDE